MIVLEEKVKIIEQTALKEKNNLFDDNELEEIETTIDLIEESQNTPDFMYLVGEINAYLG